MSYAVVSVESVSLILNAVDTIASVGGRLDKAAAANSIASKSEAAKVTHSGALELLHTQHPTNENSQILPQRVPTVRPNEVSPELRELIASKLAPRVRPILDERDANRSELLDRESRSVALTKTLLEAEKALRWYDNVASSLLIQSSHERRKNLRLAFTESTANEERVAALRQSEGQLNVALKDLLREFRLSNDPFSSCVVTEKDAAAKLRRIALACAKTAERACESITTFTSPEDLRATLKLIRSTFSQCAIFFATCEMKENRLRAEDVALEPILNFKIPKELDCAVRELNEMVDCGWRSATEIHKSTLALFQKIEVYFKDVVNESIDPLIKRLDFAEIARTKRIRNLALTEISLVE